MIFLIAGHETTGHTLAIILGLLALYPEEQDQVVQEIKSIQGAESDLVSRIIGVFSDKGAEISIG